MKKSAWVLSVAVGVASSILSTACSKLPEPTTSTAPLPEASAPAGAISDVDVTEHVKMALQQSEALKGYDISVATLKGDVRLFGMVGNQAHIDEAANIARSAAGVHALHNELTIKQ
jgi:osmotically-inducible protein OsmY